MKKLLTVLIGLLAILGATLALPQSASATQHVSLYFSPHQDDEILSMGNAISADLDAGNEVYVVLFTDGGGTGAKGLMCDPDLAGNYASNSTVCSDPYTGTDANTTHQVSRAHMRGYRLNEFFASLEAMGVQHDHICSPGAYSSGTISLNVASLPCGDNAVSSQLFLDGQTTQTQGNAVVNAWHNAFIGASLNTESWIDINPDHYHLGYALKSLCASVGGCSFWQSNEYYSTAPLPGPSEVAYAPHAARMGAGETQYRLVSPSISRYAVGPNWSVKNQFDTLSDHASHGHSKQTSTNLTSSEATALANWLSHCQDGVAESTCFNPNR